MVENSKNQDLIFADLKVSKKEAFPGFDFTDFDQIQFLTGRYYSVVQGISFKDSRIFLILSGFSKLRHLVCHELAFVLLPKVGFILIENLPFIMTNKTGQIK